MNARSPIWGDNGANSPNRRGGIFEQLLLEYNISLLNTDSYTHYHCQTDTYSIIDLSICSSDCTDEFNFSVNQCLHGSDHYPIHIYFNQNPHSMIERPNKFNFKKADWDLFYESTYTNIKSEDFESIDDLIEYINNVIVTSAEEAIPYKSKNLKKPPVPWWCDELSRLKREQIRAERARKRNSTLETKIAYNICRARFRRACKEHRKEAWREYLSTINKNTSLHKIWKKVQTIAGKFKATPTPTVRNPQGDLVSDHGEVSEILATHFSKVSSNSNYNPAFRRFKATKEAQRLNFSSVQTFNYNEKLTINEFNTALAATKESSPGIDCITYSMIKNTNPTMDNLILQAFNRIYSDKVFPRIWSISVVVAIQKPKKDATDPQNFRPISLTNCLCKLMEKIINTRLVWYLEKNNLISEYQSGFRASRSTADNLIQMENKIHFTLENRLHLIAIFFDLTKAYDTAWKHGILIKLHSYNLRGNLPVFI